MLEFEYYHLRPFLNLNVNYLQSNTKLIETKILETKVSYSNRSWGHKIHRRRHIRSFATSVRTQSLLHMGLRHTQCLVEFQTVKKRA